MGALCCKSESIDFTQEIELSHFQLLRSVGKGAFGKVRVVQHKENKKLFALKYINKEKCIKMHAVQNIIQERNLLEEINNPFICNLRYAFQDDENMFMVIDLMLGGDLRFHLNRMQTMTEEMVKFYVMEISSGLAYLHAKHIVHRDLKPDNVLLSETGHAHLTDFNIAVHFQEDQPLKAVAGSMAYMAPEVLSKKGYFSAVDWWSLGVMMYELLYGKRPFRAKTNQELTHAIIHEQVQYPAHSTISPECINVMKAFIERNVSKRLGALEAGGFEKIKQHPYFSMIDWVKLENKELTPPFIPDSKRANFDATHELEELLLEDNPLKAKPRKKDHKPDDQPLTKEQRMMEEQFEVFNYEKERKAKINIATNDLGNPLSEEQLREEHDMMTPSVNGGTSVDIKTATSTTHTHEQQNTISEQANHNNEHNEKVENKEPLQQKPETKQEHVKEQTEENEEKKVNE
ncbi:kinase-like protein [Anaeromyces robustus]|uniref:Kinase-like protein n=1 Tax=Anaeromyces robustus TaxID=1754192 RepID=A0A1Y1XNW4_9FUNG|nr:kinase-like protein [Anaeromyces robustus]|eukprot:ORX87365.1 kinase-like protein [Anaeromyces robustus]